MSRKFALIIGNNDYSNTPLVNCVNDATCLANVLKTVKNCHVELKINLTADDMYQSIQSFIRSIKPDDFVIFFFAGHGVQWGGQNFLLPCDNNKITSGNDTQRYGINAQKTVNDIAPRKPRVVLFLFDCCREYWIPAQISDKKKVLEQVGGLTPMQVPPSTLIAYAGAPDQVAFDVSKISYHGLFTKYLLEHITTPNVHIETILMRVDRCVMMESSNKQRPFRVSSIVSEDVYLLEDATSTKVSERATKHTDQSYSNKHHACSAHVDIRTRNVSSNILQNARWAQNGVTVAGGHGEGAKTNQISYPYGLYVNENQTIFIADSGNNRIVQSKSNVTSSEIVAGGNGQGNRLDQLSFPTDVIVDKETNSLIICDAGNRRVMKWSVRNGTKKGEILIENIDCWGLTMDDQRYIYVSDTKKDEVRRYQIGEKTGELVAGGNGGGGRLNQFDFPTYLFVDREYSVYVSDKDNHRVMKWVKGATEGIVVAGGKGDESSLNRLSFPTGVFVDFLGTVYVAEGGNHRVTRWRKGVTQGEVIVGGNGQGERANQLNDAEGLSFDQHGHLYVVDWKNHRVQRFSLETN